MRRRRFSWRTGSARPVSTRAGISKRTFYHRFENKIVLFAAVLHRIVDGLRHSTTNVLVVGADLREILQRLAGLILRAGLAPKALSLYRLVVGESGRFPKLAAAVTTEGASNETVITISRLLVCEVAAGRLTVSDPHFAAEAFLQMVLAAPQRRALGLGRRMTTADLNRWVVNVVDLFLNGCRYRLPATPRRAKAQ